MVTVRGSVRFMVLPWNIHDMVKGLRSGLGLGSRLGYNLKHPFS